MSSEQAIYETGPDHPNAEPYYWIQCAVSVPSPDGSASEVTMQAKVEASDVIDALDLDRWTCQAFQYLWRSGRKPGQRLVKELSKAQWCLNRSVHAFDSDWQATTMDTVARTLEFLLEKFPAETLGATMMALARDIRQRDPRAVTLIASSYAEELTRQLPPELPQESPHAVPTP